MTVTNPNTARIIFSKDAQPLFIEGVEGPLDVIVHAGDANFPFKQTPVGTSLSLDLSQILEAVLPEYSPYFTDHVSLSAFHETEVVPVRIYMNDGTSDLQVSLHALKGGTGGTSWERLISSWLTCGPRISNTYPWAKEILSFIYSPSGGITPLVEVKAKAYLSIHPDLEVTIASYTSSLGYAVEEVNVSPSVVRAALGSEFSDDTLIAYDVFTVMRYANVELCRFPAHRYNVLYDDHGVSEYLFLNPFGFPERVFGHGDERIFEGRNDLFVSGKESRELRGETIEKFKTLSGYLGSSAMIELWRDFLWSASKWRHRTATERIVLDEYEMEAPAKEPSHLSFTWHRSMQPTGRLSDDAELEEFDYGKIE